MLRIALCQMAVTADKARNVERAANEIIAAARAKGTSDVKTGLVVLPECFNCPYGTKYFGDYAEALPSLGTDCVNLSATEAKRFPTAAAIAKAAADEKVWVVAGSIPERDDAGKLYNTSMTFSPDGTLRGLHRKIHLFKINTETVKFDEAEVLTAGNSPTVVEMPEVGLKVGVGICFDIRYPQLAMHYHVQNTNLLVYPGAFNMVTGPAHWELAAKSRAVDGQQFVAVCSPARDASADYVAYGHSLVVDPWGEVVATAEGGEATTVFAELDLGKVKSVRARLPITAGLRGDIYDLQWRGQ
jgi:predicted amidohydrolase